MPRSSVHRTLGLTCAALLLAAPWMLSSCSDEDSSGGQDAVTERVDALRASPTPPADPGTGVDQPAGIEAEAGPPLQGLVGWRPRGPEGRELHLADSAKPDFEARVAELSGSDPFHEFATAAGVMPISRGLDPALGRRLSGVQTSAEDMFIVLLVPTLPAQPALERALAERGVEVLGVSPPNAYAVKGNAAALLRLAKDPLVYHVGQVPAHLKIDPLLASALGLNAGARERSRVEPGAAMIAIHDRRDADRVGVAVERLGGRVERFDDMISTLVAQGLDGRAIEELASMQEISFIDARRLDEAHLQTSVSMCGNHTSIRDNQTYGANVTLGMIDSGFELDHTAFAGQSSYPVLYATGWNVAGEGNLWDDPGGHGTHVAGIMLSRWGGLDLDGMAPRSGGDANHRFRIVRTGKDNGDGWMYNTDQAVDALTNDNGAEVINCSWGSAVNTGTNSSSVKVDAAIWQTKQMYVFSAGNTGPAAGSIGSPGAAKNVITVGNLDNGNLQLVTSSSEGPTADGRAKPDIYAPGRWVTSANAKNLQGSIDMGGTSMAAPHVAGFLGTLLDHYPTAFPRHPATTKAMLMAAATRKDWLPQRTGVLNSYETHFSTSTSGSFFGWRDTDPTPFAYTYWDYTIPSGVKVLFVVLTWIEPAPSVGAAKAVYDNVDLWVDHNKDNGEFGEWSSTSTVDNVEVVRIENPPAGDYRIKARNVSAPKEHRPGVALFYRK
ncbi:S8 family serine peptidase [Polyangium aurulentum]|uniref:S8 family serine peptidase n=1 Tax=Polyangium aurulentum TaxID=2567896 RepID=UPI0010AE4ED9|nr:S8 family serine peptidase [Polyangium aurulentum]UQA59503.1 S8 family serine peptidase [Polyangium aurulentum]